MAARVNGGTSIVDATSAAATRPAAWCSGIRSTLSMGRTPSRSRRRASSIEIVEEKGRTALFLRLLDHVCQLGDHELFHREPDGGFRSRQRDDDPSARQPGACAAHHRGRADLFETQHPEQFPETVQPLLQHRRHCFVRAVARRDAGPAGGDDRLHIRIRQLPDDRVSYQLRIVFDDRAAFYAVTGTGEEIGDRATARVGGFRSRIAHREDEAVHRARRLRFVLFVGRHSRHCTADRWYHPRMSARVHALTAILCAAIVGVSAEPSDPFKLDREATRWVDETLKKLTVDEKIGQLIVPSFESGYMSTDSDTFDELSRLVKDFHVGGFHVFGATQLAPAVLLNSSYGSIILGQPFSAAFLFNRLQG